MRRVSRFVVLNMIEVGSLIRVRKSFDEDVYWSLHELFEFPHEAIDWAKQYVDNFAKLGSLFFFVHIEDDRGIHKRIDAGSGWPIVLVDNKLYSLGCTVDDLQFYFEKVR